MEPPVKRRRKCVTNLTLSKKSKEYRRKRSLENVQSEHCSYLIHQEGADPTSVDISKQSVACQTENFPQIESCPSGNRTDFGLQIQPVVHDKSTQCQSNSQLCDIDNHVILAILPTFLKKISEFQLVRKFITFLSVVADDRMEPTNLALLCLLDRAQYAACKSTTNMSYHPDTVQFWTTMYLLFGNSALNVCRGPGNTGQLICEQTRRGLYDPKLARTNFAVPSIPTIRKLDMGYCKHLKPGLIPHTLDIAQKMCTEGVQFILSMDGKKCTRGLGPQIYAGDIYLFGAEKPNLVQSVRMHEQDLKIVKEVPVQSLITNTDTQWYRLRHLLNITSRRVKRLRLHTQDLCTQRRKMIRLSRNNPDNVKRYKFGLSRVNASIVALQNLIKRTLLINDEITVLIQKLFRSYCGLKAIPVDISQLHNYHSLLPAEYLAVFLDLHVETQYIKSRSKTWLNLKKECLLSVTRLYDFLGLQTLTVQQELFQDMLDCKPMTGSSQGLKEVAAMEPKAIATLLTCLIYTLCPPCHVLLDVGPKLQSGMYREKILEYSADGLMQCMQGDQCEFVHLHRTKSGPILIKFHYPVQDEQMPSKPLYEPEAEMIPELVVGMDLYNAEEMWLISCTDFSTTLQVITSEPILASHLRRLIMEELDVLELCKPKKLPAYCGQLKKELQRFVHSNCTFMFEVPTCPAYLGELRLGEFLSPYSSPPLCCPQATNFTALETEISECAITSREILEDSFQGLRQKASEVLVWMLQDKDRIHHNTKPSSLPVAFALRGESVSKLDLRFMTNRIRDELAKRNIDILSEVYDGEWKSLMLKDETGFPLTKLQLARQTWGTASGMSREKCLAFMLSTCTIHTADLDLISSSILPNGEIVCYGNITAHKKGKGQLVLHSNGGPHFPECVSHKFLSNGHLRQLLCQHLTQSFPRGRQREKYGLNPGELNLLDTLPNYHHAQKASNNLAIQSDEEDTLPDLEIPPNPLEVALQGDLFPLLSDMLHKLQSHEKGKWENETEDDLFPELLRSGSRLNAKCSVKELQLIGEVLKTYSGRKWYCTSENKAWNVNSIISAFGSKKFISDVRQSKKKSHKRCAYNPSSLRELCNNILTRKDYPLESLQVSVANVVHEYNLRKWEEKCTVPMQAKIPVVNEIMDLYSYPEFSQQRGQLEFRTYDNTHSLTRIRRHLCTTGYDFAKKEAFRLVADERPDILSRAVVYDMVDGQNAFTAMRFFGENVEQFLKDNGHCETANFIRLIRQYHKACDQRGISADYRILALYELHTFLLKDIDFNQFPFPFMGQYIRGMPWQTFEALLQNCSSRIQMYSVAKGKTYNARAPTTLNCESQFADLCRMDKSGSMYPKAANVPKLFWKVVTLNFIKHRPDKSFVLCTSNRGAYPVHLSLHSVEQLEEDDEDTHVGMYRNHYFDHIDMRMVTRYRRSDVTEGNRPLSCVPSTRTWFRCNEEQILSETLQRLRPTGVDDNIINI